MTWFQKGISKEAQEIANRDEAEKQERIRTLPEHKFNVWQYNDLIGISPSTCDHFHEKRGAKKIFSIREEYIWDVFKKFRYQHSLTAEYKTRNNRDYTYEEPLLMQAEPGEISTWYEGEWEPTTAYGGPDKWAQEAEEIQPLIDTLNTFMEVERELGEPFFMNAPDRWYEPWTVRCAKGHVSHSVLRCSVGPRDRCLACYGLVTLTFPEDEEDGPLMSLDDFKALRKQAAPKDLHEDSEQH